MLPLADLIQHSLIYGAILSVMMSVIILTSLYFCPRIWIPDAPADVQALTGPLTERDRLLRRLFGVPTLVGVFGLLLHAILRLAALAGGLSFVDVALSTFLIIQVFNVVDLLLIDWLLVVKLRPAFVMLPGMEQLAGVRDYGFHFRAFLKGVVGSLIASVIIAAIAVGLGQLLG